jgi:3-oxoacyl-[acyl-carrier protein] reductase
MESKKIIVTGTSRGIGKELVLYLAQQGHSVLAISRKQNDDFKSFRNIDIRLS